MIDHAQIDHDKVHKFLQEDTPEGWDKYPLNDTEREWVKALVEYKLSHLQKDDEE